MLRIIGIGNLRNTNTLSKCYFYIGGDFNARVGESNNLSEEIFNGITLFYNRKSLDLTINKKCKQILELMENNGFILVNG